MRTKSLLVSFLAVFAVVVLAASISASNDYFKNVDIKVDGTYVYYNDNPKDISVELDAGDTVDVFVRFTSDVYDKDVTVTAEFRGYSETEVVSKKFDVETNQTYTKTLSIKVPYDLSDVLSDNLKLNIDIEGDDYSDSIEKIDAFRVQRPSYDAAIKSVSVDQSVEAGETFPVEIVLKNIGYNDLDDVYVKASIEALGVMKSAYFGDIVALECDEDDNNDENYGIDSDEFNRKCNEDDTDTVNGKLYLEVPYGVPAGVYTLEVMVQNEDTTSTKAIQIAVENAFETTVFKSGNSIWIVNPTDNVVGYRIVAESPATVDESMVFVPAGASKTIAVDPNTDGEYSFEVSVFTVKGELVDTITFSGNTGAESEEGTTETNPIVILTVILAIIFIVLLIVLIVLIGKKPEKSGEFGESYY